MPTTEPFLLVNPYPFINGFNLISPTIDALNERQIYIGQIDWDGAGTTKAIRKVRYRVNNETLGAGTVLTCYLADLDTVNGPPFRDDGIKDQWVDMTPAQITPYTSNTTPALSSDRTVNKGDTFCVVFELTSYTSGSINIQPHGTMTTPTGGFPGYSAYVNGAYTGQDYSPNLGFEFADGTYGYFKHDFFSGASNSSGPWLSTATEDTTSFFSGNERGMRWVPSRACTLTGCGFPVATNANTSSFELRIYQNNNLIWSKAIAAGFSRNNGSTAYRLYDFFFPTPFAIAAGDEMRFTILATSAVGGVYLGYTNFDIAADKQWVLGSEDIRSCHRANSGDTGTWYQPASGAMTWALIHPRGAWVETGPDISGSHTISGVVSLNGSPVSGATVRLIRQSDGGYKTTTTNGSGQYSFSVASGYQYHALAEWTSGGQKYNAKSLWDLTPVAP
jgi:hypothetical protein